MRRGVRSVKRKAELEAVEGLQGAWRLRGAAPALPRDLLLQDFYTLCTSAADASLSNPLPAHIVTQVFGAAPLPAPEGFAGCFAEQSESFVFRAAVIRKGEHLLNAFHIISQLHKNTPSRSIIAVLRSDPLLSAELTVACSAPEGDSKEDFTSQKYQVRTEDCRCLFLDHAYVWNYGISQVLSASKPLVVLFGFEFKDVKLPPVSLNYKTNLESSELVPGALVDDEDIIRRKYAKGNLLTKLSKMFVDDSVLSMESFLRQPTHDQFLAELVKAEWNTENLPGFIDCKRIAGKQTEKSLPSIWKALNSFNWVTFLSSFTNLKLTEGPRFLEVVAMTPGSFIDKEFWSDNCKESGLDVYFFLFGGNPTESDDFLGGAVHYLDLSPSEESELAPELVSITPGPNCCGLVYRADSACCRHLEAFRKGRSYEDVIYVISATYAVVP